MTIEFGVVTNVGKRFVALFFPFYPWERHRKQTHPQGLHVVTYPISPRLNHGHMHPPILLRKVLGCEPMIFHMWVQSCLIAAPPPGSCNTFFPSKLLEGACAHHRENTPWCDVVTLQAFLFISPSYQNFGHACTHDLVCFCVSRAGIRTDVGHMGSGSQCIAINTIVLAP